MKKKITAVAYLNRAHWYFKKSQIVYETCRWNNCPSGCTDFFSLSNKFILSDESLDKVTTFDFNKVELAKDDQNLLSDKVKNYVAYDINLFDSEKKSVQPDGKIGLKLLIPNKFDKKHITVYRIEDGKLVEYETEVDGDYAVVSTDHFSIYIVAEDMEGSKTEIDNPETGDNIIFFVGMMFIAVIGIAVTTKYTKHKIKVFTLVEMLCINIIDSILNPIIFI